MQLQSANTLDTIYMYVYTFWKEIITLPLKYFASKKTIIDLTDLSLGASGRMRSFSSGIT